MLRLSVEKIRQRQESACNCSTSRLRARCTMSRLALLLLQLHSSAAVTVGAPVAASALRVRGGATTESGEFGTTDFVMAFEEEGKAISPWHDIPLEAGDGLYNMLTEIPRMTNKKMEVATKVEGNPIMQDEKKGKPRLYHGPIFWNYGCLPQTWEDPNVKGSEHVGGAFGDNDPVDVVEIGARALAMGSVTPVKVLGCLSMLDDGELDWKVIVIAQGDVHFDDINDIDDIDKCYPGTVSGIREWFRWYKTPDGKPVNAFGHGERALSAAEAKAVIAETHDHYRALLAGEAEAGDLWLR